MARPPINLGRKIKDILKHVEPLPPEAGSPLAHYRRSGTDLGNLLEYVRRAFDQIGTLKPAVVIGFDRPTDTSAIWRLQQIFRRALELGTGTA
jgi:hypothetical protein